MRHLTPEQLVEMREPGLEPGLASAREHLAGCAECQAEAFQLDQRSARLRALPSLRPARDHWPEVRQRLAADRRRRRIMWLATAGLAAAASVVMAVSSRSHAHVTTARAVAISSAMERSNQLEELLQEYQPDRRVVDGATARVAGDLEDRIAVLDRQLELAQLFPENTRDTALLRLWRQRVGLLDALVDVHLTRASNVGM